MDNLETILDLQGRIIRHLHENNGRSSKRDLTRVLHVGTALLDAALDKLAEAKEIRIEDNANRSITIILSDQGYSISDNPNHQDVTASANAVTGKNQVVANQVVTKKIDSDNGTEPGSTDILTVAQEKRGNSDQDIIASADKPATPIFPKGSFAEWMQAQIQSLKKVPEKDVTGINQVVTASADGTKDITKETKESADSATGPEKQAKFEPVTRLARLSGPRPVPTGYGYACEIEFPPALMKASDLKSQEFVMLTCDQPGEIRVAKQEPMTTIDEEKDNRR